MNFQQKIDELKSIIDNSLARLIDNDYVLWDVPYYYNIGDLLIWEGTMGLLESIPHKMVECKSCIDCKFPSLSDDTVILLQGGGNFGDLWTEHQMFRMDVIRKYPNNKIIILPQTIFYESSQILASEARIMAQHQNLHICARDNVSFQILKDHFSSNNIMMLPDMAFCIDSKRLKKYGIEPKNKTLLVKRVDKEASQNSISVDATYPLAIKDWPTFECFDFMVFTLKLMLKLRMPYVDKFALSVYKQNLVKKGVVFVSQYKEIYTTRLHVFILSILLHKPVKIIDNSYGKNRAYYDCWLSNLDGVDMIF